MFKTRLSENLSGIFKGNHKNRLIALVVTVLGISFVTTAVLSYVVSHARMRDQIVSSELPLTSDTVYSEIQRDFLKPIQASALMAADTFLRDWALSGEQDVEAVQKYLAEVKRVNSAFTTYFVSARSNQYYTPDGILKTISRSDEHDVWFFRLERSDIDYVLDLDTDQHHDNALTIFINYRVFDYAHKFIGIAGMGLNVDAVRNSILRYQQQFGRTIYFVDQSGEVVMAGDEKQLFEDIRSVPGLRELAANILDGKSGALEYVRDGETHLLNVRYIPELKWYLFVERVEDLAMANIRHTLYVNLAIAGLATAIVALILAGAVNRFHAELDKYATTDSLTGLTNRRAFDILFHQAALGRQRMGRPLSLVMFDIDHFKSVNDQFGHLAGDKVIQSVAHIISERCRASDIACRWGGEEMLLLLQNCRLDQALSIANDIRKDVEHMQMQIEGKLTSTTISAGVAEMSGEESEDSVIARADSALYAAKNAGRNKVMSEYAEKERAASH